MKIKRKIWLVVLLVLFGITSDAQKVVSDFQLKSTDKKWISLKKYPAAKGFIVVFLSNHCPFANRYTERLNLLSKKYAQLGIPLIAINSSDTLIFREETFAKMMEFVNLAKKQDKLPKEIAEKFVLVLSPFAPHMAEELWARLGHAETLAYAQWPKADPNWLQSDTVLITVHINGKKRAEIEVKRGQGEVEVKKIARELPNIAEKLEGQSIKKIIFVPEKLVNFIV